VGEGEPAEAKRRLLDRAGAQVVGEDAQAALAIVATAGADRDDHRPALDDGGQREVARRRTVDRVDQHAAGEPAEAKRRLLDRAGAQVVGEDAQAALAIVAIEDGKLARLTSLFLPYKGRGTSEAGGGVSCYREG
jgi:adenine/guanine phosphoribosyltransferase-like PRPP-binding protein